MIKILDFHASWCGQCKALAPILDEVVKELGVKVTKVDAEKDLTLCTQYGIMNLPTLVILNENKEVARITGVVSKQMLLDKVKSVMQ